ncbi:MAG: TIGR04282 family arsenosugar biosynthesis glycosyltransferase [Gemmatimonadales bacterium]
MIKVLLFAKAPRPGFVKTRLAKDIGPDRAVQLYRRVGAKVVSRVAARYPLEIWYDPPDALHEMRGWLGNRCYRPQAAGDLGARLSHAFRVHFEHSDLPAVAIGADAPDVDASTVRAASRALEQAPVVVGPAVDGGYYLLGLNDPCPQLFRGIPWSTPDVLRVTVGICERLHLEVVKLKSLRDLDTADDLAFFGL